MNNSLVVIKEIIESTKENFTTINSDISVYMKESSFAQQILQNNDYAMGIAIKNKDSLKNAIINLANMGLTLNPAEKKAYLVPRKGSICLDISYMGLLDIAICDGAIMWAKAVIVRANDTFVIDGLDNQPRHQYNPFDSNKIRGDIVGVYCVAKVPNGDYMTDTMSVEDINAIKQRSSGANSGKTSPWSTDYEEMAKKTVIKRASKYWKGSSKLSNAVHHLNTDMEEGINFSQNKQNKVIKSDTQNAYIEMVEPKAITKEVTAQDLVSTMKEYGIESKDNMVSFAGFHNIDRKDISTFKHIVENFEKYFSEWQEALLEDKIEI